MSNQTTFQRVPTSVNKKNDIVVSDATNLNEFENDPIINEGIKGLRDKYLNHFSNLSYVKGIKLNDIHYDTLKELYMATPIDQECLLYLLQNRNDDEFDNKHYTKNMIQIYSYCYKLPKLNENDAIDVESAQPFVSKYPFDELFIWSLTLYSGKTIELDLIKYYWTLTKHPIACALVAIILYKRLIDKHFVPDELKQKLEQANVEFQKMASETLHACYDNDYMIEQGKELLVTQDLLVYKLDIFYARTVLDMAIDAEAYQFVSLTPVQDYLTDIWYERINPDASNWKILVCLICLPLTFLPIRLFRNNSYSSSIIAKLLLNNKNKSSVAPNANRIKSAAASKPRRLTTAAYPHIPEEYLTKTFEFIPNREIKFRQPNLSASLRLFWFLNAPLIKYVYHLLFYVLFLVLFSGFILFDYYPIYGINPNGTSESSIDTRLGVLKITITEALLIYWVSLFVIENIRQFIQTESTKNKISSKIKAYFLDDPWNIYDVFVFIIFFMAVALRFFPKTSDGCLSESENCFEAARTIYCVSLVSWYARTTKLLVVLSFWGPKLMIIIRMVKQLLIFVVLLLLFILPFGASFHSIMNGTVAFDIGVITSSFNTLYWPVFGEIGGVLDSINSFQCPDGETSCTHGLGTYFLFIGLAVYIIICNLLLLNMIIAIFSSSVDETHARSMELYRFQRYGFIKEYYKKTILPAPFVIVEFIILAIVGMTQCCRKHDPFKITSFSIGKLDEPVENEYIYFQKVYQNYWLKNEEKDNLKEIGNANDNTESSSKLSKILSEIDQKNKQLEKSLRQLIDQKDEKINSIKTTLDQLMNIVKSK